MAKYYKISKKDKKLIPPPEYHLIKLTSFGLLTFLLTLLVSSACAPVQPTNADELLLATQSTGDAVSLTTTGSINLSMQTNSSGTVRTAQDIVYVTAGASGYQLYIGMNGDNNALIRDGAIATRENPITYADTDIIPSTLTASIINPTNLANDTWGFATLAQNSGTGSEDVIANGFDSEYKTGDFSEMNNKFAAVPTHGNDLLIAKRSTTANAVPTYIYYGARTTTAKPSGLYRNTVVYTAIGNSSITNLASVSPSRTNIVQGGQTLTITTPNTLDLSSISSVDATVSGVTCTNATPVKNNSLTNVTCTSPALSTGWHEVIVNLHTTAGTTETYVVNPGIEYFLNEGETNLVTYMQDFTVTDCAQMTTNTTVILQDRRDNNVYTVAKLSDNNCWMTSNLKLGSVGQNITLTSSDTDISNDYTISADKIQNTEGAIWEDDTTHVYVLGYNNYGNLYNWFTATAGTGTTTTISGDAPSSICPKGWKLPPSSGNGSYYNLMTTTLGLATANYYKTLSVAPYNFTLTGSYNSGEGTLVNTGKHSYTYMRTAYSDTNAYVLGINAEDGYGNPSTNANKSLGRTVRCVFENTMQNFDTTSCANLETAKIITLIDVRDLNTYNIAKLADGYCWMTTNLMLGNTIINSGSISINSTTSDYSGTAFNISSANIMASGKTNNWTNGNYDVLHIYARPASEKDSNGNTYGNLYNWYTATAKSGTENLTSGNASSSLCPKNWHLPYSDTAPSYKTLFQTSAASGGLGLTTSNGTTETAVINAMQTAPYSLPFAGRWMDGALSGVGNSGLYFSRTAVSSRDVPGFNIRSSGNYGLEDTMYKYIGYSVRCVLY